MSPQTSYRSFTATSVVYDLLDPIPFGLFVGALIFDALYDQTADVLWGKSAAWLIAIGLVIAIVPRFINLVRVWVTGAGRSTTFAKAGFFSDLVGIACAIVNAFVHSRDAYGVMPQGLWLSILTVLMIALGRVLSNATRRHDGERVHA